MNAALIEQIIQLLIQAVEAGIQYGPQLMSDIKMVYGFASTGTTVTPDQQALVDTTLASANQALQAKVALDVQQDTADASTEPQPTA